MSGVGLIEIVSDSIAIVDASLKIYEAIEDASGPPRCFHHEAARLPVVQESRAVSTEEYEENKEQLPSAVCKTSAATCIHPANNMQVVRPSCLTGCTIAPIFAHLHQYRRPSVADTWKMHLWARLCLRCYIIAPLITIGLQGLITDLNGPLKIERNGYHSPSPKLIIQTNDTYVTKPFDRRGFEIAIICALPLEYDAVSLVFDEFWDEEGDIYRRAAGDENTYTTGRIGKFNVVLVLLSSVGKISVASAAASVRWSYPCLRLALLVGICGGVPRAQNGEEILLGDVIISNTIVQYDLFVHKRMLKDDMSPPNNDIRNLLTSFSTRRHRTQLQKRTAIFLRQLQLKAAEVDQDGIYHYPGSTHDQLFVPTHRHKHHNPPQCICHHCNTKADAVCESVLNTPCSALGCVEGRNRGQLIVRKRLESKRRLEESNDEKAQEPALYVGAIASGDTVMQSGEHRDQIAMRQDVIAFEMEGAGVWGVIPCIVVKGVSDYADSHKNNMWQNFAAATAAAALKAILERYIQPDKSV
ncbi:hypothetical protein M431DRAFT_553709 [Trichoderma harzianum CBS 226.95]|uniref:Nucleoside phosphorylase domain-containing protein n=1 Tax=Trichoderma harzianum CBS 226.95 TaxID=983964 RepID=A0A2T4ACB2_TRIHA|nr:hypothetical protein M431DRAFT_553709 [Trichoderma harzianum CBS 226.95]PTB54727.1 hypothetical protein M431DRAFT_553709 [Trichoderma harzianum CBS 226.95]